MSSGGDVPIQWYSPFPSAVSAMSSSTAGSYQSDKSIRPALVAHPYWDQRTNSPEVLIFGLNFAKEGTLLPPSVARNSGWSPGPGTEGFELTSRYTSHYGRTPEAWWASELRGKSLHDAVLGMESISKKFLKDCETLYPECNPDCRAGVVDMEQLTQMYCSSKYPMTDVDQWDLQRMIQHEDHWDLLHGDWYKTYVH